MASVNSAFGTVTSAPLQRAPVHSLTELQNSYLPAHFQSQHLSVSTTPVSTPESRNSDGSRVNDSGGSPTTISPDGISHNFGLGRKTYIPVYRLEILLKQTIVYFKFNCFIHTDPYHGTTSSIQDSASTLASSVVNSIVFPTSVTASMSQAANHISSQVRKMQENTLMVCTWLCYEIWIFYAITINGFVQWQR